MRERDLQGEGFTGQQLRRVSARTAPHRYKRIHRGHSRSFRPDNRDDERVLDITRADKAAEEQRRSIETLRVIEAQLTLLVEASSALLASPESAHVSENDPSPGPAVHLRRSLCGLAESIGRMAVYSSTGLSDNYERSIRPMIRQDRTMPADRSLLKTWRTSDFVRHRLSISERRHPTRCWPFLSISVEKWVEQL